MGIQENFNKSCSKKCKKKKKKCKKRKSAKKSVGKMICLLKKKMMKTNPSVNQHVPHAWQCPNLLQLPQLQVLPALPVFKIRLPRQEEGFIESQKNLLAVVRKN